MIVLMSIWTVFLIAGSILLSIAAYEGVKELYAQGRELKTELKDKTSELYKEVINDIKTELTSEIKSTVEESSTSASSSVTDAYTQFLRGNS